MSLIRTTVVKCTSGFIVIPWLDNSYDIRRMAKDYTLIELVSTKNVLWEYLKVLDTIDAAEEYRYWITDYVRYLHPDVRLLP